MLKRPSIPVYQLLRWQLGDLPMEKESILTGWALIAIAVTVVFPYRDRAVPCPSIFIVWALIARAVISSKVVINLYRYRALLFHIHTESISFYFYIFHSLFSSWVTDTLIVYLFEGKTSREVGIKWLVRDDCEPKELNSWRNLNGKHEANETKWISWPIQ